jgi:hypothetical protein
MAQRHYDNDSFTKKCWISDARVRNNSHRLSLSGKKKITSIGPFLTEKKDFYYRMQQSTKPEPPTATMITQSTMNKSTARERQTMQRITGSLGKKKLLQLTIF